jgi:hypothetical protein
MTSKVKLSSSSSVAGQETEVARFRRERDEAVEQLAAASQRGRHPHHTGRGRSLIAAIRRANCGRSGIKQA